MTREFKGWMVFRKERIIPCHPSSEFCLLRSTANEKAARCNAIDRTDEYIPRCVRVVVEDDDADGT